jgi:putative ATP-binding cassette transporter
MTLLELLNRESIGSRRSLALVVALSGASNAAMIAVINAAAQSVAKESVSFRYLALFLLAISMYVLGLRFIFDRSTRIFEGMVAKIRVRLAEKIGGSELLLLDRIEKAEIAKHITQDTTIISESQGLLVAALHSAFMVFCTGVYVLTLSLPAFAITLAMVLGGTLIYLAKQREMMQQIRLSSHKEVEFMGMTNHLVDGWKEIKLNEARSREVLADLREISDALRKLKVRSTGLYNENAVFSQCFFYILIGSIVFVLPRFIPTYGGVVSQLVASILFMIGPLSTIVTAIPALSKANFAAEAIDSFERTIDQINEELGVAERTGPAIEFRQSIEFKDVEFRYLDRHGNGFAIGPITEAVRQGEILFLVGGNGSGKTTFLKLLTALYFPASGTITVDGAPVCRQNLQNYRELFTAIYSDFHLFDKLYGLGQVGPERVAELLRTMRLDDKTAYDGARFTTLDLSTGQRKRLALAVALLEDRPIVIFDEWAADQDPEFRRYFYEVVLQEFKRQGKTVVAVTHDDRYFHLADRVVKMDYGRIVAQAPTPAAATLLSPQD